MTKIAAGASTQSRANRPLPYKNAYVIKRSGVREAWRVGEDVKSLLTWVFSQDGPVLGYTSPRNGYTRGIRREMEKAMNAGMYGPGSIVSGYERDVADLLCDILFPFLTDGEGDLSVRWFANGSCACDAAVRLARAITRRNKYVSIGYHGSSVMFAHAPQNKGVPDYITKDRIDLDFGDIEGLKEVEKAACVIVEVPSDDSEAEKFLEAIRDYCYETDEIMILDELVTGFRLGLGGAAERYSIMPDLACYGKAMANGKGIAALVGWEKIMSQLKDKVFYSNTFNGDPLNLASVKGTLNYLREYEDNIYPKIWSLGEKLRVEMVKSGLQMVGHAPRMDMVWDDPKERYDFCQRMVEKGVIVDRPFYVTMAHNESDVVYTGECAYFVLKDMEAGK